MYQYTKKMYLKKHQHRPKEKEGLLNEDTQVD